MRFPFALNSSPPALSGQPQIPLALLGSIGTSFDRFFASAIASLNVRPVRPKSMSPTMPSRCRSTLICAEADRAVFEPLGYSEGSAEALSVDGEKIAGAILMIDEEAPGGHTMS